MNRFKGKWTVQYTEADGKTFDYPHSTEAEATWQARWFVGLERGNKPWGVSSAVFKRGEDKPRATFVPEGQPPLPAAPPETIEVPCENGRRKVEVLARVGPFVIHDACYEPPLPGQPDPGPRFNVTHAATGLACGAGIARTVNDAKTIARKLAPKGVDWDFTEPSKMPSATHEHGSKVIAPYLERARKWDATARMKALAVMHTQASEARKARRGAKAGGTREGSGAASPPVTLPAPAPTPAP